MAKTIQNLPPFFDFVYTNKDGSLTPNAKLFNDLTFQYLNQNFSFGMQIPNKTTAQITVFRDDLNIPVGTMWFDTDVAKLKVKTVQAILSPPTPGTIEEITST